MRKSLSSALMRTANYRMTICAVDRADFLLRRIAPTAAEMMDTFAAVRRGAGRPAGRVRIHSFRLGAELFLAPILAAYARRFPDVVLDISLDDQVVDLVAAGFDLGIRLAEALPCAPNAKAATSEFLCFCPITTATFCKGAFDELWVICDLFPEYDLLLLSRSGAAR